MTMFVLALGAFILLHVGVSATPLRAALVKGMGEGPYRGLFALASAAALVWMIFAFGAARDDPANAPLWTAPSWARHITYTLVLLGFLLAVTGLLTPGPTTAGFEGTLKKPEPAKGILRVTRHPFLWGVALWGLGHLLVNPEKATALLFGGLAAMTVFGTQSIDRKSAARDPEAWAAFKAATSNVPFAAIVQGRNRFAVGETLPRVLVALLAYAAAAYFHRYIAGVPALSVGA